MKSPQIGAWTDRIERPIFDVSEDHPISLLRHRWTKSQNCRYDMHYGLEIGILLRGRMQRYFGEGRFSVGRGDVWLCGMWEPHGYAITKPPCEAVVMIVFPPVLTASHFPSATPIRWLAPFEAPPLARPKTGGQVRRKVLQLGEELKTLSRETHKNADVLLRLKLLELLLLIQENWNAPPAGATASQTDVTKVHHALRLVMSSRTRISVRQAAAACGLHRNTLGRLFQDVMGIPFSEFGLRYRIAAAAEQLLQSGDPVKKIAVDWGFTDASHLHRCFLKHYGCSPSQYLDNYRKDLQGNRSK